MTRTGGVLGAVLAGGLSRRMGQDKAGLVLDGQPLVARTVDALAPLDATIVVGRPRPIPGLDTQIEWAEDHGSAKGPLAGVITACRIGSERGFEWVLFVPCDLPGLQPSDVEALVAGATAEPNVDVVIAEGAEQPNWAFGMVRVSALASLEAAVEASVGSLRGAFARLDQGRWQPPQMARLGDVDTPTEFAVWTRNATGEDPTS